MARTSASELLIRQRLGALTRALPRARAREVEGIHEARVATRRLREALPLVARGARGRKLARGVRRLTRALGPVRELDVALATLDEVARDRDVPRAGVRALQRLVRGERQLLHRDLVRTLDRADLDKLARKAVAAAREHGDEPSESHKADPGRLAAARRRAGRRARALREAIENAAGIYLPDRLHDVRIAVKKLRYSMEIARELSGSRATARILALKRVQDLLGRMHDLEVLIARTRAVQASPSAPTLRVSSDMDRLVRRLETECRQLHGQYMAVRPSLIAICEHAIAAANASERAA